MTFQQPSILRKRAQPKPKLQKNTQMSTLSTPLESSVPFFCSNPSETSKPKSSGFMDQLEVARAVLHMKTTRGLIGSLRFRNGGMATVEMNASLSMIIAEISVHLQTSFGCLTDTLYKSKLREEQYSSILGRLSLLLLEIQSLHGLAVLMKTSASFYEE